MSELRDLVGPGSHAAASAEADLMDSVSRMRGAVEELFSSDKLYWLDKLILARIELALFRDKHEAEMQEPAPVNDRLNEVLDLLDAADEGLAGLFQPQAPARSKVNAARRIIMREIGRKPRSPERDPDGVDRVTP